MKSKFKETPFNQLRINQVARVGGYEADPTFLFRLWASLEQWFNFIAEEKKKRGKKAILRYYDIWLFSGKLKKIMDDKNGKL